MKPRPLTLLGACLILAGCGGAAHSTTTTTSTRSTTTATDPAAQLEQAVRRAISEEHSMSVSVLWTNQVPANPTVIGGPSLAILRRSVAQRRSEGVRVRVLSEHFRILSVNLAPSYATATAIVVEDQRVQPTYPDGRARGKPSATSERVRLELHRVGNTERFLVWKVTLLK
jgi:hypothetical protein